MTQAQATKPPGPFFEKGHPLAENFDGETCGSLETFSGEPCSLPAQYGRTDPDPDDQRCVRHVGDEAKCGAPTLHGGRCLLPSGFGREDVEEGPCVHHQESVRTDRRVLQAEFLVELSKTLTMSRAAERVGIARYTAQLWKAHNEEFATAVDRLLNGEVSQARLERAEEVLYERVTGDDAGQADRIFFLVNQSSSGEGWRDVKFVRHQHNVRGGVLVAPATPGKWKEAAQEQQTALQERVSGSPGTG